MISVFLPCQIIAFILPISQALFNGADKIWQVCLLIKHPGNLLDQSIEVQKEAVVESSLAKEQMCTPAF